MKRTLLFVALAAAAAVAPAAFAASFTYHGVLQDAGKPAQGKYDIELTLYATPNGGSVIGGPLTLYGVDVNEGSFATEADFGPLAKSFKNAYVGVKVRSAGTGEFASLGTTPAQVDTNSSCPGSWSLDGNAGNPSGSYLGTADNTPLLLKTKATTAGELEPSGGAWFGGRLGGIFTPSADGIDSFAIGSSTHANGARTFAGGFAANTPQDGSFMWGDSEGSTNSGITATNAIDQFVLRSAGGVAINGLPKNNAIELSIYPSFVNGPNYSNMFFGNRGDSGGILMSSGDQSSTTSNDARFYIDEFDGTNQARHFVVNKTGVVINDPAAIPANANTTSIATMSVVAQTGASDVLIDMYPHDSANPTLANYWSLLSDKGELDIIGTSQASTSSGVTHKTFVAFNYFSVLGVPVPQADFQVLGFFEKGIDTASGTNIFGGGDITIQGNAYKPTAGGWLASSDRRIKSDIVPLTNAIDTLQRLHPVSFHYTPEYRALQNHAPDKEYLGFIAQDFAEVFPDAVETTRLRVPGAAAGESPILAIDTNPALITAVAAVQDLARENADLHQRIDELAARLTQLEARKDR